VPYAWVPSDCSSAHSSPTCTGTFAPRATCVAGNAVLKAARQVRERILAVASRELEIDPADLEVADGAVSVKGTPA